MKQVEEAVLRCSAEVEGFLVQWDPGKRHSIHGVCPSLAVMRTNEGFYQSSLLAE